MKGLVTDCRGFVSVAAISNCIGRTGVERYSLAFYCHPKQKTYPGGEELSKLGY